MADRRARIGANALAVLSVASCNYLNKRPDKQWEYARVLRGDGRRATLRPRGLCLMSQVNHRVAGASRGR